MASLSSGSSLGNSSVSSLLRSASSIQNEINSYNDSLAAYQYELSTKTDADLSRYQRYLGGRIDRLRSTGNVVDASKALSLTKTLTSATRSNVSANIQRENIQLMSGNATLQDKYNAIVGQFQRAIGVGDMSLAQQLESQAYSVSQSIQYQAAQAAQAGSALAKASQEAKVSEQSSVAGSLDDALKQLNNDIKNLGVKDFNKVAGKWVDANRDVLQTLGAVIPKGAQPNYWDLVRGIQNAKYNALVLKAQYQAPTNPAAAQNTLRDAALISQGATKISTLGGDLTIQEIQQASQDPAMFAYDSASGKYTRTAQVGYQYINGQVMPQYSGVAVDSSKHNLADLAQSGIINNERTQTIFYLNPNQTAELHNLGLNFTTNKSGTTGTGVSVQLNQNAPQWLKDVLTNNGVTNVYTDAAGNLQFKGSDKNGNGLAYYTLINLNGLSGIFEHFADGSTRLAGGNYGFDAGAAQLLINMGQQKFQQIQLQAQAQRQAQLKLAPALKLPTLRVTPPHVSAPTAVPQPAVHTQSIQPTVNPQHASPQSTNILQPAGQVHSNVQGIPLQRQALPGIKL